MARPYDANVNYAVGEADAFVTLFEMKDDAESTVIRPTTLQTEKVQMEVSVPSLSLKQLCERYFLQVPTFMNVGVGGDKVLEGNDWDNPQCVPKLIFAHKQAEAILSKQGYTKVGALKAHEVFVHNSASEELNKRLK
jgi:hypothetical protein